ncbi:hypothetical protein [Armatimonas rosea]|uniref:Zinc ribbon domain-containing protein n=1 Tax=Armatimonas rosea TaxID=685828 RepID=A0A7W9SUX1_ARMRO|nr:hypothetical protein [Armatimonas rosea]MBB6053307.1 hypothetical protein [Armatimonas rosea]
MSTPPLPLDPVYCRKCKNAMPPDQQFCGTCGWNQKLPFDAEAEAKREAQEEQAKYEARKRQEAEEAKKAPKADAPGALGVDGKLNPANPYTTEEYTKQYTTLYWYQALAIIGFITGPIAIGLFLYGVIQQGALRRRAAEMGVNPEELARAARARFWDTAGPIITMVVKSVAILGAVVGVVIVLAGGLSCGAKQAAKGFVSATGEEHDPLIVGKWTTSSHMGVYEFEHDGVGSIYETGMGTKLSDFDWHTTKDTLYWIRIDPVSGQRREEKYQYSAVTLTAPGGDKQSVRVELHGDSDTLTLERV